MSFKVKDLSISLSVDGGSTCTTLTKPTGCVAGSIYWEGERVARQNLTILKAQLRNAITSA